MIEVMTLDVMVDLWTMHSSSSSTTVALILIKTILTQQWTGLVISSGFVPWILTQLAYGIGYKIVLTHFDPLPPSFYLLQKNAKVVTIDSYEDVPENDEKALMKAVAHQPVSVAIEASGSAFQFYQSVCIFLLS